MNTNKTMFKWAYLSTVNTVSFALIKYHLVV